MDNPQGEDAALEATPELEGTLGKSMGSKVSLLNHSMMDPQTYREYCDKNM